MWSWSGAPFNSVLQVVSVCSVLGSAVVVPVLETIISDLGCREMSSNDGNSKGARMTRKSWFAMKNIWYGLTGSLLAMARRNGTAASVATQLA